MTDNLDDLLESLINEAPKPQSRPVQPQRASPVQPQRAVVSPVQPQRAVVQPAQPQRAVISNQDDEVDELDKLMASLQSVPSQQRVQSQRGATPSSPSQRALGSPAQPQRAVVQPAQPQRAVVQPAQPQRAVVEPVQPQRAVLSPTQPQRAIAQPVQPQRAVVEPVQPQRAVVYSGAQPQRAVVQPAQPQRAVVENVQPQRAVVSPGQPQRAVVEPAQPQRAVVSPGQPQRAVLSHVAVPTPKPQSVPAPQVLVQQRARPQHVDDAALEELLGKVSGNLDAIQKDAEIKWEDETVEKPDKDLDFNIQALPVCWVGDDYSIKLIVKVAEYLGGGPYRLKNIKSIDVSIETPSGRSTKLTPTDNMDGTYTLPYKPEEDGEHHVVVKILGRTHFDFNFRADDAPYPPMCTASAPATKARQPVRVTIVARNALGNPTTAFCNWEVNVSTPPGGSYYDTSLDNEGGGVYVITFTPACPGVFSLYLSLKGQQIKNYPLNISVS
eukprot:TRINITY_DN795_c0_g1_i1.p1 TRINITY_DN795_c0_g1~~TRINITY_DN795_c0_g1_i1.p1  ORF type:complete len:513 (+),score=106.47 TRINITY_DN795_c0_g1_i1:50-1540(+)